MCGIAGIVDIRGEPVAESTIRRMIDSLRHRGPDDDGVYVSSGAGLANSRLAILDLSAAGHQPMTSDDGSLVLVYNGELYNYRELGRELEQLGPPLRSRSDTEVVLRAFSQWGPSCVERFQGMFAFAVWDNRTRELFAARDRFGIKPFYFAFENGRFVFASEIKALIAAGHRVEVSAAAVLEYFTFQNLLSDLTLFEGVRLLPAGHTLALDAGGLRTRRYWDLVFEPDDSVSESAWTERLRESFATSVRRHLISDVPVGSYLSGGMDSASIVAVASREIRRLMTFTGGFDLSSVSGIELVFDERKDAEAVADAFSTEHYEMVMHAGDMAWVLPELVWHLEDLRLGMAYQNHYIARLASKFVKVALTGAGGDELFAGYPWRYSALENTRTQDEFDVACYGYWSRLISDADKPHFFTAETRRAAADHSPFDVYRAVIEPGRSFEPLDRALYFEAKTFLHGLLVVQDRLSMAHSLEERVPFLDDELVDLARRIPARLKLGADHGKRILREAMSALLPAEIVAKRKQGFSPPDGSWYRGPTMDYIREVLLDRRTLERGWFEPESVVRILEEHLHGKVNHRLLIWSLLCFEWWNRLFVDGEEPQRHMAWHEASRERVAAR